MFHAVDMAKTNEILARYRPIAPKPSPPQPPLLADDSSQPTAPGSWDGAAAAALHLRPPRPCRARKRGRAHLGPIPNKRPRAIFPILPAAVPPAKISPTYPAVLPFSNSSSQKSPSDLLTIALLPRSPDAKTETPVEQDLLQKLQEPKVIAPQPVRPVGSSISVELISPHTNAVPSAPVSRRAEEVEEEVESDKLPAVVSDSRNRVRLANSAYKEMVGQPECPWLDSMILSSKGGGLPTNRLPRRISGEVMLDVGDSSVPKSSNGFSCRVKIEWACNGMRSFVNAPCDVIRLSCESKDYLFAWRFHTSKASATHCNA